MNKTLRREQIAQLFVDGERTFFHPLNNSQELFGVQPSTVRSDLLEMYPDQVEEINAAFKSLPPTEDEIEAQNEAAKKAAKEAAKYVPSQDPEYSRFIIEQVTFDSATGKPLGKPFEHNVNKRDLPNFLKSHQDMGYTILKVVSMAKGAKAPKLEDYYSKAKLIARKRILEHREIEE